MLLCTDTITQMCRVLARHARQPPWDRDHAGMRRATNIRDWPRRRLTRTLPPEPFHRNARGCPAPQVARVARPAVLRLMALGTYHSGTRARGCVLQPLRNTLLLHGRGHYWHVLSRVQTHMLLQLQLTTIIKPRARRQNHHATVLISETKSHHQRYMAASWVAVCSATPASST